MELFLAEKDEQSRMEVYNEYLRKIPQLLEQLASVEKMYEKAVMELKMLQDKDPADTSVELYTKRLQSTKLQCENRQKDIINQLKLIYALKAQIEKESTVLKSLE